MLETVEAGPSGRADAAVIWLHGLGADGHDFEPVVPQLALGERQVRFVFPHAPVRPVTLNGGMPMRAWYDITGLDRRASEDAEGIRASAREIDSMIARECERGLTIGQIALAGFSQGGAIALQTGLRYPARLAGITWRSRRTCRWPIPSPTNARRRMPTCQSSWPTAASIPCSLRPWERRPAIRLLTLGYAVEWNSYPMPHAVCPEEIADIGRFLTSIFAG